MIKQTLSLVALLAVLVACGGGKYDRSEISAGSVSSQQVEEPLPMTSDVASSNSSPVIYDYPGSTRQIGTTSLSVPAFPPTTTASPTATAPAQGGKTYTVQQGDTLWRIANHHGVTVDALKHANGLADNIIKPGQMLKIP